MTVKSAIVVSTAETALTARQHVHLRPGTNAIQATENAALKAVSSCPKELNAPLHLTQGCLLPPAVEVREYVQTVTLERSILAMRTAISPLVIISRARPVVCSMDRRLAILLLLFKALPPPICRMELAAQGEPASLESAL